MENQKVNIGSGPKGSPSRWWDYWAAESREPAAYLKPETAKRALASMPSWPELVPAGQLSVPLVSVAGIREQAALPSGPTHLLSLRQGMFSKRSGGPEEATSLKQFQLPPITLEVGRGTG